MIDGFCQNGKCKVKASVRFAHDGRLLDLCPEDAAYFLELRDERKNPEAVKRFVDKCHKD